MTNQTLTKNQQPEILFEDTEIIVCYKPAGVATQTRRLGQQDMESILKNYRAGKKEIPYIGVVHRLDQPVEGVMVFAKTKEAAAGLSQQVRERTIGKKYYAAGAALKEKPTQGTLTDYIAFDKRTNVSTIVPEKEAKQRAAKKAVLDYRVIGEHQETEDLCSYFVFDITLHTGRHHQIRLQLAHFGYPLLGDQKYADASCANVPLALCSYCIAFAHPKTGKEMEFLIQPKNPILKTEINQ